MDRSGEKRSHAQPDTRLGAGFAAVPHSHDIRMRDASAHAQKSRVYGSSAAVVLAADRFVAGDWSDLPDL